VVAAAVKISLSPHQPSNADLAQVDTFLTSAILRILNNTALPIHAVNRAFEQTFRLPFRAFRQASLQAFLEAHREFDLFDIYTCPANMRSAFPPPTGTGHRYFSLCDHIEEQEVVLWRLREELSSLETSLVGHSSNSHLLSGFVAESDDMHDFGHCLTFKVVAVTPNGVELPILIEPRTPAGDAIDDITTARSALTRIVSREMAILRKTDETVGFEMTDHKHQIASLKVRIDDEVERLCRMYDEAESAARAQQAPAFDGAMWAPGPYDTAVPSRGNTAERKGRSGQRSSSGKSSRAEEGSQSRLPPAGFMAPYAPPFHGYGYY